MDLAHCQSLVDARTRAILINNPSNPCGSNFSEAHLKEIVAFAQRNKLPIIADEIYGEAPLFRASGRPSLTARTRGARAHGFQGAEVHPSGRGL